MSDLLNKKCVPCEGGIIPFDISEIHKYQKKVDGWDIIKGEKKNFLLNKKFKFKNFLDSQNFINQVGKISENEGELSVDKSCSWMEVECLGACVNAPMMQINDDYYEDLDKEKTLKILDVILDGKTPKPGSYRGRINNEPENNRKTLLDLKNA